MKKNPTKRLQDAKDTYAVGDRRHKPSTLPESPSLVSPPLPAEEMPTKKLWVLGDAVQDVTVEIDLELLLHEDASLRDSILLDESLSIKDGVWLTTQSGLHHYSAQMRVRTPIGSPQQNDGRACLTPGEKYDLMGGVSESLPQLDPQDRMVSVRCEDVSWGGGGLNVVRYIRALAPLQESVPIVYSDIAMSHPLGPLVEEELLRGSSATHVLATYSADRYLEVYLDSLSVEAVLHQPVQPEFRRNFVISRVRTSNRETDNKIVCRGSTVSDTAGAESDLLALLNGRSTEIGAILVDSIKSKELFNAAYSLCKLNPDMLVIFALTKSMQKIADALVKDLRGGTPPSNCVLLFNEMEVQNFAHLCSPSDILEPFMTKPEDIPNLKYFAQTVHAILKNCPQPPRVYVTLGPRGSLGVDEYRQVVYVGAYTKQKATVFDTNTCGDAFCGAVSLLEWAKRFGQGLQRLAPENAATSPWEEMRYFMAVATAAAYSRATSRLGRVDRREVEDLLRNSYLGSEVLGPLGGVRAGKSKLCDEHGFLVKPSNAYFVGIESGLAQLMTANWVRTKQPRVE
ncbi:hypothetical protein [uncultured Paludibaculum sp.]|uniref:hypothetical protein n=1 Tax=uncultured Paludibaculum sp. TaxID=1765020 RepID=UPI002AAB6360|nr:hypothetical protein [uncultured Paludibaculum sp.]